MGGGFFWDGTATFYKEVCSGWTVGLTTWFEDVYVYDLGGDFKGKCSGEPTLKPQS